MLTFFIDIYIYFKLDLKKNIGNQNKRASKPDVLVRKSPKFKKG